MLSSDINECASSSTNNCAQLCNNNAGSYTCSCRTGYALNRNGRTCDGNFIDLQLLVNAVIILWFSFIQISMSVLLEVIDVHSCVPIQWARTPVGVGLDIGWIAMDGLAQVSYLFLNPTLSPSLSMIVSSVRSPHMIS